jgi:predicted nucleic acid-binding protein
LSLVLDASLAIACLFEDEVSEARLAALERVGDEGAWVPSLWHLEVANGLQVAVRRGRCSAEFVDRSLARLACLPVTVDGETAAKAWGATLSLARGEALTIYDAAYLELSLRRGLPLASCDGPLNQAALRNRIALVAT